ncbi:unnamed protein product, partial [Effrenium voratum]
ALAQRSEQEQPRAMKIRQFRFGAAAVLVALADGPPACGGSEDEDAQRGFQNPPSPEPWALSLPEPDQPSAVAAGRWPARGPRGRRDRRGPGKGKRGGDQGRQQRDQRLAGAVAQATAAAVEHVFFQAVVTLAEYRDTASVTEGSPASPPSANPVRRVPSAAACGALDDVDLATEFRHPVATLQDVPGFLRSALRAALVQALRQVRAAHDAPRAGDP